MIKSNSSPMGLKEEPTYLQIDNDTDIFIKYLVKKLKRELANRLKTEEQSAQVIEQLGKTIARLVTSP